jgi:hypothetical protein
MLKYLVLFLLMSCDAPVEEQGPGDSGAYIENIRVQDEEVNAKMRALCGALEVKSERLPDISDSGEVFKFNYSEKGCGVSKATMTEVETEISEVSTRYVFRNLSDGRNFGFPSVETESEGVFSRICQSVGELASPIQLTLSSIMTFTTKKDSSECRTDSKGICVYLEKARLNSDNRYEVHTWEWIKISTVNPRKGFFTYRKSISRDSCAKGSSEKKAVLN